MMGIICAIIGILIDAACGYLCYVLAQKYDKNPIMAAVLGVVFNILAVVTYALLGKRQMVDTLAETIEKLRT